METMINVSLSDGSEIGEKYYVRDDVPRSLINDMAFKEAYAKYNGMQKTITALVASFDWMSDDEINSQMEQATFDEMTLAEIFSEHWKRYNVNPLLLLWFSVRVWFASRTIWKLKWNWEYYVSIPFWRATLPIRKKLGIHHFSDDAEGDC